MQSDGLQDDKSEVSPLPLIHVESEGVTAGRPRYS